MDNNESILTKDHCFHVLKLKEKKLQCRDTRGGVGFPRKALFLNTWLLFAVIAVWFDCRPAVWTGRVITTQKQLIKLRLVCFMSDSELGSVRPVSLYAAPVICQPFD